MSITNYGELQTAVGTWINKSNLAAYLPDFITLAATRIYYGSDDRELPSPAVRTHSMQARETPTPSAGVITLPTRYLATIRLSGNNGGAGWTLDFITPSAFSEFENFSGVASKYTFMNNAIHLAGTGAQTITHDYYQSFAAFVSGTDTNALLLAAPGLWLHAALLEAALFQKDDTEAARAFRMYMAIVGGLNKNRSEHAALVTRVG